MSEPTTNDDGSMTYAPKLLTPGKGKVVSPDNIQVNVGDTVHRTGDTIPPATQASSDVFRQEDSSQPSRLLTPESRGQTISTTPPKFQPGQGKNASTRGKAD